MALFKFIAVALIISACFLGGESHQSRSGILATDADTVLPAVSAAMALPPFAGDDGAAESDAVPDTSTSDYTGTSADASKSKDTSDDAPIDPRKWIPSEIQGDQLKTISTTMESASRGMIHMFLE